MDLLEIRKKAKQAAGSSAGSSSVSPAPMMASARVEASTPTAVSTAEPPTAASAQPSKPATSVPQDPEFATFAEAMRTPPAAAPASPPKPAASVLQDPDFAAFAEAMRASTPAPASEPAGLAPMQDDGLLDLASEELYRHAYAAETASEAHIEVLACRLADEDYGIDIHRIKEIIKPRLLTEVPRAPQQILGIITLRGQVIPIFDLHGRLGLARRDELGRQAKIVVVNHGAELFGLIVDAVIDVARIRQRDLEPTPSVMLNVHGKFIQGIGRAGQQMLILLNLDEVLNLEAA